ncbi:MAG: iron-sulfur cluster-binding domain-containing protein [Kofleriaceae bacterium]|nr:iron-sulfur cluster-binding domain-containing protein [Kofleriaceae bacterium]
MARTVETVDAVTLELRSLDGPLLRARPGQFVTVELAIEGTAVKRAYSIVAQPGVDRVCIAVKKIADGVVSPRMHALAIGDTLSLRGPLGLFVVDPDVTRATEYLAIAGGSGITPIVAIIEAILLYEPQSRVALIYGNRSAAATMFRARLRDAAARSHGRLRVQFVDEQWQANPAETSCVGQLDELVLQREINRLAVPHSAVVLLCGPTVVMQNARNVLRARGVDDNHIHEERFGTPHASDRVGAAAQAHVASVIVGTQRYQFSVAPNQTLLEGAQAANVPMPSSCTMGGCGACAVLVEQGELVHDEPNCLTAAERTSGKGLACVARLATDCIVRVANVGGAR